MLICPQILDRFGLIEACVAARRVPACISEVKFGQLKPMPAPAMLDGYDRARGSNRCQCESAHWQRRIDNIGDVETVPSIGDPAHAFRCTDESSCLS